FGDLIDELLSVPERAAWIDDHERCACGREHLVVPSAVPLIEPRALWTAVDQQDRRILLARLPVGWLDDEALHLCAGRASEPEILRAIERQLPDRFVILVRDGVRNRRRARSELRRVHFGRKLCGVANPCECASVARQRERGVVVIADEELRRAS